MQKNMVVLTERQATSYRAAVARLGLAEQQLRGANEHIALARQHAQEVLSVVLEAHSLAELPANTHVSLMEVKGRQVLTIQPINQAGSDNGAGAVAVVEQPAPAAPAQAPAEEAPSDKVVAKRPRNRFARPKENS